MFNTLFTEKCFCFQNQIIWGTEGAYELEAESDDSVEVLNIKSKHWIFLSSDKFQKE